jgi:TolB-like protein/Tfp pilus assembly protein PilF
VASRIHFGCFEVDLSSGQLYKRGFRVSLQEKSFQVLASLLEQAGEVVTRQELQRRLWREEVFVDFENNLNTAIARLREALGDSAEHPRFVETLPKRGYKFIAPVERCGHTSEPRLAVMIFENLNHNPEQDYFAEGISDALITELGSIRSLRVISRQSVLRFKDTKKSLPEIARELRVDALVEGCALHSDKRVRVSAQLIRAEPEQHLWAQSYECELGDVLEVQGSIARSVAEGIEAALTAKDVARLARPRPVNPEAQLAYLKARHHWGAWTKEGIGKALHYLDEATKADPEFAPAYSMLSYCMTVLGYWGHFPQKVAYSRSKDAALKALALDDQLCDAHTALGVVKWFGEWDLAAAEREIQHALEINPSSEFAHLMQANFLIVIRHDHDRALEAAGRALDLDPLSINTNFEVAWVLVFAGEYGRAIDQSLRTLELYPDSHFAQQTLGWGYIGLSDYDSAEKAFQKTVNLVPDSYSISSLAYVLARTGRRAAAEALLADLLKKSETEVVPEICLALLYGGLGDRDRAFELLEKCYQERHPQLFWLPLQPGFSPLRDDDRYDNLLRRVRLLP